MTEKSFEQVIAENGRLIYTHVGNSMYPFIKPRDLLTIEAVKQPLRRLDVPLYKRGDGKYILHRIIRVRENDYIMCGDNCLDKEEGITDSHILGVLTQINRKGKDISVYSFKNRLFAHFMCDIFPMRHVAFFFRRIKNAFIQVIYGIRSKLQKRG